MDTLLKELILFVLHSKLNSFQWRAQIAQW
jgi:hypothetical protein